MIGVRIDNGFVVVKFYWLVEVDLIGDIVDYIKVVGWEVGV